MKNFLATLICVAITVISSLVPRVASAQEVFDVETARLEGRWVGSPVARSDVDRLQEVIINRLTPRGFVCSEHYEDMQGLGNTLGRDCLVVRHLRDDDGGTRLRMFTGPGDKNEQYFGYGEDVLAPFESTVVFLREEPDVNVPGFLGEGRGGMIVFRRDDGTMVVFAHVTKITARVGDRVVAGQPIAKIGNNGVSWGPHIHIGAWRDKIPLQPRFDLFSGSDINE